MIITDSEKSASGRSIRINIGQNQHFRYRIYKASSRESVSPNVGVVSINGRATYLFGKEVTRQLRKDIREINQKHSKHKKQHAKRSSSGHKDPHTSANAIGLRVIDARATHLFGKNMARQIRQEIWHLNEAQKSKRSPDPDALAQSHQTSIDNSLNHTSISEQIQQPDIGAQPINSSATIELGKPNADQLRLEVYALNQKKCGLFDKKETNDIRNLKKNDPNDTTRGSSGNIPKLQSFLKKPLWVFLILFPVSLVMIKLYDMYFGILIDERFVLRFIIFVLIYWLFAILLYQIKKYRSEKEIWG